jgi:Hexapeptide repeat of succinyl-transferase
LEKNIKVILNFLRPVLLVFFSLFFEKKYLTGRYFDVKYAGILWGFRAIWQRNILRLAPPMPFPVAVGCVISNPNKIHFHPDDINNFQTNGSYFQNFLGEIFIGRGSFIASNVGIITANHDLYDLDKHQEPKDVRIGTNCWIGMNSVILPGVVLGPRTIVAAGSVVTKSFATGNCVIAGNPAKVIKQL